MPPSPSPHPPKATALEPSTTAQRSCEYGHARACFQLRNAHGLQGTGPRDRAESEPPWGDARRSSIWLLACHRDSQVAPVPFFSVVFQRMAASRDDSPLGTGRVLNAGPTFRWSCLGLHVAMRGSRVGSSIRYTMLLSLLRRLTALQPHSAVDRCSHWSSASKTHVALGSNRTRSTAVSRRHYSPMRTRPT